MIAGPLMMPGFSMSISVTLEAMPPDALLLLKVTPPCGPPRWYAMSVPVLLNTGSLTVLPSTRPLESSIQIPVCVVLEERIETALPSTRQPVTLTWLTDFA